MKVQETANPTGALTVSIIHGDHPSSHLKELLEGIPQIKIVDPDSSPETLWSLPGEEAPDMVLVDLDGGSAIPGWLERLTQCLARTAVLVCSPSRDADFLIRGMQCGVREFLPLPLTRADLEAAVMRVRLAQKRLRGDKPQGRVVAITGHKGGVGCTTIAINLAVSLAETCPDLVALVDLGRPFPDVENFLNQEVTHTILDLAQNLYHLDPDFVQKTLKSDKYKLGIIHGSPDFRGLEVIASEGLARLFNILRTLYQWIIVDLSHWPDEVYRRVIQDVDQVLLITELTVPDLRNLKRMKLIFQDWGIEAEKVKVVVNRHVKGGDLSLAEVERIMGQPAFCTLPSDYFALMEAVNQGLPLAAVAPKSKICLGLQRLAHQLLEQVQPAALRKRPRQNGWRRFLSL